MNKEHDLSLEVDHIKVYQVSQEDKGGCSVSDAERLEKEIEMLKTMVAKGTERRVEDNKEWFDAQSVLVEENARLQKEIERYRDYLILIRVIGTFGTDIKTKEVVRSDEANLAHEALEESKCLSKS